MGPAIQSALNACPEGQVVQLQAGTYNVSTSVFVPTNRTLRGAGPGQTIVQPASPGNLQVAPLNVGMLWPNGQVSNNNFAPLASLLKQGYNATKACNSSTLVMIHTADADSDANARWFYDGITAQGVTWDINVIPEDPSAPAPELTETGGRPRLSAAEGARRAQAALDEANQRTAAVETVHYLRWDGGGGRAESVRGRFVVLAAHTIETAKILLLSGLATTSKQVGCNLMDHLQGSVVCYAPEPVYPRTVGSAASELSIK